jgi:sulfur-carrier protein adenylyltransferase/sulfurtransferase
MVQLTRLFKPVASMEADEARDYIAKHQEGDYLILDVRQPGEYEEAHIPGGKLLPLPELASAYKTLDPEKPTIVHCAIGGRSRVAAQMLSGLGFKEVYNLAGGIKAYQGQKAAGPHELNLDLVRGDETPTEITSLACGMERALQLFYESMRGRTRDLELQELFGQLGQAEEHHRQRLRELDQQLEPAGQEAAACSDDATSETLEGGFKFAEFMAANEAQLDTVSRVLDLAMMLETQALDLYLRLADRCAQAGAKNVLYAIADEEKIHLARLGRLLEEKSTAKGLFACQLP